MKLLLDTQIWLWWQAADSQLGARTRATLEAPDAEAFLSAASTWEIAIKYAIGKLPLPERPSLFIPARLASSGVSTLSITPAHTMLVEDLPRHHRDPFDRILVAQARSEGMRLVTADETLTQYDVEILWAGHAGQN